MSFKAITRQSPVGWNWELFTVSTGSDDCWRRWDALNQELNQGSPVLDSKFLRPMCQHFGEVEVWMALLTISGNDQGGVLLQQKRTGDWSLFVPGQACVGPLMIAAQLEMPEARRSMATLFRALPGAPLRLRMPKQDPNLAQLTGIQNDKRLDCSVYGITTSVDVSQEFETYWGSRHKDVRRQIRKSLGRLDEAGLTPELRILRAGDEMAMAVAAHGELESCGWKGQQGSAIHASNEQGRFYTKILECFADINGARVYQMLIGDRLAASLLTIVQEGIQVVLKTTYDESLAQYSPGRIIDYLMFAESCSENSIKIVENYTSSSGSDRKWSTANRPILDLDYYRIDALRSLARLVKKIRDLVAH